MKYDKYDVTITLKRTMLATNPFDPYVLDTHIIGRQRAIIQEKSKINKDINKYMDALEISKEKGEAEVQNIFEKMEEQLGYLIPPSQRKEILEGNLKALAETFAELETKGTTVFFYDHEKKRPLIGDHMIYGFMKAAAEAICRTKGKGKGEMLVSTSYSQSMINQYLRCEEQFLMFDQDIVRHTDGTPKYLQRSLRAMTAQGPRVSLVKSEQIPAGAKLNFTLKVFQGSPITEAHIDAMLAYGDLCGLGQWRNAGYGQFEYTLKKTK